jgi:SAM-dependent methyltransferase
MEDVSVPVLKSFGHCSTCDREVDFVSYKAWLRDSFLCSNCGSLPRERALMLVIDTYFPAWRDSVIHESSPVDRGASLRLAKECSQYVPTQYLPDHQPGCLIGGMRCENLEALTFSDETIDLHVTQDVLEHVFHPSKVFSEISRTLRPGGMHIFTVPLVKKNSPSKPRARINDGEIIYLEPAMYHGSPIGDGRSLVAIDWGFDICQYIFDSCGLFTQVVHIDDLSKGIRAEYIEVLITFKPGPKDRNKLIP